MKSFLTIIPDMYADWMANSWSAFLGQPPTGPAVEPKLDAAQASTQRAQADTGIGVKLAKKVRAKPAVKKSTAKPAAKKSTAKRAVEKSTAKPAVKK